MEKPSKPCHVLKVELGEAGDSTLQKGHCEKTKTQSVQKGFAKQGGSTPRIVRERSGERRNDWGNGLISVCEGVKSPKSKMGNRPEKGWEVG